MLKDSIIAAGSELWTNKQVQQHHVPGVSRAQPPVLASPMADALAGGTSDLLSARIAEYLRWEFDPSDRAECLRLTADIDANRAGLEQAFLQRLQFGTAGIRGPMGVGFARMNAVTTVQTAQGVAVYLLGKFGGETCGTRGIVLGFDGRRSSERFAHAAAAVFLSRGFKVYLNSRMTPTPACPYTVVQYRCLAGLQITASHNPKGDNGCKVYLDNGAQVVSPEDRIISQHILENLEPWPEALELLRTDRDYVGLLQASALSRVIDSSSAIFQSYMADMTADLCSSPRITAASNVKVVYSAMHGVGYPYIKELFRRFGFQMGNFYSVPEQQEPDPDFPTLPYPNPEERGATDMGVALAECVGASVVILNDPDADRFAVVERQKNGTWKVFHGDELGIIFCVEALSRLSAKGVSRSKMLFVCSAVSSRMLQRIALAEGARFEETLTGFKWMMDRALSLAKEENYFPALVYEEALGYGLNNNRLPDKDGVSAAAVWIQLACKLQHEKGMTMGDMLEELREKYGYFVNNNRCLWCHDHGAITRLLGDFRNRGQYRESIGPFKIRRIRDAAAGYDNGQPNHKCTFPRVSSSEMLTIFFENGAVLTLRNSGTEPKLKWYAEMLGHDSALCARRKLQAVVDATVREVIQPHKYKLHFPDLTV